MADFSDEAREGLWRGLLARFDYRVRAYCRTTRCDDEDVEQIVWDLWAEATEHEPTIRVSKDAWPILVGLLRPLCARRAALARREVALSEVGFDAGEDSFHEQDRHPEVLADLALQRLQELPDKQRIAVDFRYRWAMPYWAVAAGIDTSEATARVHVFRGLSQLRQLLSHSRPPDTEEPSKP